MPQESRARDAKLRVMVVDDDKEMRRLVATALRLEGFEPIEAATGEEGLALAREAPPDLIILDVLMPGMDGFEVCQRVREDPVLAHAKVLMLTAHVGGANVLHGHAVGADTYVGKPFEVPDLMQHVRSLLARE